MRAAPSRAADWSPVGTVGASTAAPFAGLDFLGTCVELYHLRQRVASHNACLPLVEATITMVRACDRGIGPRANLRQRWVDRYVVRRAGTGLEHRGEPGSRGRDARHNA